MAKKKEELIKKIETKEESVAEETVEKPLEEAVKETVEKTATEFLKEITEKMQLAEEIEKDVIYKKLSAPIPAKYLITYTEDGKTFTGYHAQYAINLLNETFGLGRWETGEEILKQENIGKGWFVAMKVVISFTHNNVATTFGVVTGYGAAFAKSGANAYKGAKTSALKNACRYLGIGNELYLQGFDDDITPVVETPVSKPEEVNVEEVSILAEGNTISADELIDKINTTKSKQETEALRDTVNSFKSGDSVKKLLLKGFNDRLIYFSE